MIRILCGLPFALMAAAVIAGCADDSYSGRQRSAPGYDQPVQQHRYDEPPPNSQRDPWSRSQSGNY
jgi:hypothetical protein